jgi:hypothetical protein
MAGRLKPQFLIALAILAALYSVSLLARADQFTLTPFREGQTAITAFYMAKGESPFLAYHLPVFGQPWAVPFEFPLFQWLAAKLGGADVARLRWAGKLLSLVSWGGCLGFAYLISQQAPISKPDRRWFILLLAAAPIFVGYSPAFLMETFTLLFALGYLWAYLALTRPPTALGLTMAMTFGTLAALSKPTTWVPFAGVIALAMLLELIALFKANASLRGLGLLVFKALIMLAIPLVVALTWVKFGDAVKLENPLASGLTSASLSSWNYGSLAQKLSPTVWGVTLGKQVLLSLGLIGLVTPLVLMVGGHAALNHPYRSKRLTWLLLALTGYLLPILIFTNLHYRHDYYLVANGFFLVAAVALAISYLRDRWPHRWVDSLYLTAFLSAVLVSAGYLGLKKSLAEPAQEALVKELKAIQTPGNVIYYGFDYSAKMPYEVGRRALMMGKTEPDAAYDAAIAANKQLDWVAIALASPDYEPIAVETIRRLQVAYPYRKEVWPGTTLISQVPLSSDRANASEPDLLRRVAVRLETAQVPEGGVVYWHSWLTPTPQGEGFFELMLRRGNDLFFIDGKTLRFYRLRHYFKS